MHRSEANVLVAVLLACTVLLSACGGGSSSESPQTQPPDPPPDAFAERVAQVDSLLAPLASTLPTSSVADLEPLSRVAMARVVGMGEATHGTREFFHLKHKIFRWLVETRGVRVFAMESDIAEGYYIDRYVQTGEGDLEAIMLQRMHYWPWYTEEVRDLIQWMADYNASNPETGPLRYIGIDCQNVGMQPEAIVEMVAGIIPELIEPTEAAVMPLAVSMAASWPMYQAMSTENYESMRTELIALQHHFAEHEQAIVAESTPQDFAMLNYLLNSLIESHRSMFYVYNASWEVQSDRRERCLADNVQLIEELVEPGVRIGLWAHNLHVTSAPYNPPRSTMGRNLRQDLGNDYRVIGFSFGHGEFMAMARGVGVTTHSIAPPPLASSINELFHAASDDNFILDIGAIPGSELLDWLRIPRAQLSIGAVFDSEWPLSQYYVTQPTTDMYDAIIHVDRSTASVPLPLPD